jgi:cathepsin L
LALIGAAAILLNHQQSTPSPFESWKTTHSISFTSEVENAYRERIFLKNFAEIEAHNANEFRTYSMGLNQFSAMTQEEFAANYLTLIVPDSDISEVSTDDVYLGDVDWVSKGAVTGVKNQGSCGSCWAFSTTGGLEGLSKIGHGSLQSFSEQQLVDCDTTSSGCNGGLMDKAYVYTKTNGITHESEYPYKGVKQTCKTHTGAFKNGGYSALRDCSSLANAVNGRPVSVAVDATNWSKYSSGIFNNCKTGLNHGVLLVGLTEQYWHVKNSWGTTWGEKGYIRLSRGDTCGICRQASYPTK